MKLLCLNIWGGRVKDKLFNYLQKQSKDTDIFCFQEVFDSASGPEKYKQARPRLFMELKKLLPDFAAYFNKSYDGWVDKEKVDFEVSEGQAFFFKSKINIKSTGAIYIAGGKHAIIRTDFTDEPKILQYAVLYLGKTELLVANVHGSWFPGNKLDTPKRLEQSKKILDFLKRYNCPKILCGDFNLLPKTKSISVLEKELRNLIREFKITNTRNEITWEEYSNKQSFADYTFVSPKIKVENFKVPYNTVSDHLPMLLTFSL